MRKDSSKKKFVNLKILELASKGQSIRDIAMTFQCSPKKVELVLSGINSRTIEELGTILHDKIPLEYAKSLVLLDHLMKRTISIEEGSRDERVKLQAIGLIKDINEAKNKLLVDGTLIHNAIIQQNSIIPSLISQTNETKRKIGVLEVENTTTPNVVTS